MKLTRLPQHLSLLLLTAAATQFSTAQTAPGSSGQADTRPDADALVGDLDPLMITGNAPDAEKGYAPPAETTTATRTSVPLLETPISVQTVTRQTIEDQAAVRLTDVYKNVSGVVPSYTGFNTSVTESPIIRGFEVRNTYWNGFRLRGQSPSVLANVERIDILKGPGSVLYGQSEPGGLVNLVTKPTLDSPYRSIEQRIGSFDYYETLLDFGGPVTADGDVQYRLNASYQNAGSFRDFVDNERFFIAPSMSWQITPATKVTLEGSYMKNDYLWDYGLVFSPANFSPAFSRVLPDERFLQEPGYRSEQEDIFASYRIEHEVNENWNIRHLFLYHRFSNDLNSYRLRGVTSPAPGQLLVGRRYDNRVAKSEEYSFILDSVVRFDLGKSRHEVLAGVDFSHEPASGNTNNGRFERPDGAPVNAFNPVYGAVPTSFTSIDFFNEQTTLGFYAQDQITLLNDRLHLLIGGRYDRIDQDSRLGIGANPPDIGSRSESAFTFRGGALYEVAPWLHPFVSYSEGFVPNDAFTTDDVDPETSNQFEFGLKMPFYDERLVATLSFYQLTKENVVGDSDGDGLLENFGELRSKGIEFDLTGRITDRLSAIATYAYTDTEVLASDALPVGSGFTGVPENTASLWMKYDFQEGGAEGLSVGSGLQYVGARQGNNADQFEVDGYVRWDAFARYRWILENDRALSAQLNFQNILDKSYVETVNNTNYYPGAPFNIMASLKFEF